MHGGSGCRFQSCCVLRKWTSRPSINDCRLQVVARAATLTVVLLLVLSPAAVLTRTAPAGPAGPFQLQGSSRHLLTYNTDAGNCQVGSEGTTYLDCGSDTPACCTSSTCYYNPTGAHIARSASNSGSSSSSSASTSSSSSDDDGSSSSSSSASSSSSSSSGDSNEPGVCQDSYYLRCC